LDDTFISEEEDLEDLETHLVLLVEVATLKAVTKKVEHDNSLVGWDPIQLDNCRKIESKNRKLIEPKDKQTMMTT
jgi:hypothetical protein